MPIPRTWRGITLLTFCLQKSKSGRSADCCFGRKTTRSFAVYAPELDQYSPDRLVLMSELHRAIEHGQLILHYQPKVTLRDGRIAGVEALVRWQHPTRGLVPPNQSIPLAEGSGWIKPLAFKVVEAALRQRHVWHRDGLDIDIMVNLSARSLQDPNLANHIGQLIDTAGPSTAKLGVEITESTLMVDAARAMRLLTDLHDLGVEISIDDFGTGYSSLAYLNHLPADEIKIDKSFVIDMDHDSDDAMIVRSIIDLGHNLGLRVVAEGVETQQSMGALAIMGCGVVQGYFLSPPIPAEQSATLLRQSYS